MIEKTQQKIYALSLKWGKRFGLDLPYFIKNGFWVTLRQVVGSIGGLLLSVAFARLATQKVFGQYQFVLSILSIVSILSIPGLNTALTRSVARGYDGDYKKVVKTSFLWSLLGILTLLFIGGYYYLFQNHPLGIALMISSIFFPFLYAPNTWDSFLQGKSRFDISAKYSSIQTIINTVVTIAVVFFSRNNLVPIIISYLISYTFFNGYYFWKSLKYIENKKVNKGTIKYGWFLTGMSMLGLVASNIDKILVGVFLGATDLAAYTIVSIIAIKIKDLFKIAISIFMPKFSKTEVPLEILVKKHYVSIFSIFLAIGLVSCLYYLIIPLVNNVIFSDKFAKFAYMSQIFSITVFVAIPLGLLGYYNMAKKNKKIIVFSNMIFYTIKITLSAVLIIKYALFGAVIAFNISIFSWFIIYIIFTISLED